jgi:DNA repair exonuclease SbcCD ATPase subunit
MGKKIGFFGVILGVSAWLAASPAVFAQQSLADVARKEQERREALKEPAKVYTNKDLGNVPPSPATTPSPDSLKPASATGAPGTPSSATPGAPADAAKEPPKTDEPAKDQAYWAGRMKALQTQLERDSTYVEALQSRINALTADFTARDDPAQQNLIARDKQKSIDELNRLKQTIEDTKKAIADLEEEARRAGVPPGWLRS